MKRWLFIFASLMLLLSASPICSLSASTQAETVTEEKDISNDAEKKESIHEISGYHAYYQKYMNSPLPTKNIDLTSESCIAVSGAVSMTEKDGVPCLEYKDEEGYSKWSFTVEQPGLYEICLTYHPIKGSDNSIVIGMQLDEAYPYKEWEDIRLPRWFVNNIQGSVSGSTAIPEQIEYFSWNTICIRDSLGLINEVLTVYLSKGNHVLTVYGKEEPFYLKGISFCVPQTILTYSQASKEYPQINSTGFISLEGEDARLKNSSSLTPKSDTTSASLSPSSPSSDIINYIGSSNWKTSGETLQWDFEVSVPGLYCLGFRYRQSYVLNGVSYRRLEIDGKVPFREAAEIGFAYKPDWSYMVFADKNKSPYLFYLGKGKHTISLTVALGPMAEINNELAEVVNNLGVLYRKIAMITGEHPDANRDYDLFNQIHGMKETLTASHDSLLQIADRISSVTGSRIDSNISVIRNMANVLQRMLDKPFFAADYKSDYHNNFCSLGALVSEMRNMALDLDEIHFYTANEAPDKVMAGGFTQFWFSCRRFIYSFLNDYNDISNLNNEPKETISLWVNWGRDQAQVLNNLISESFTPNYGIQVQVKIVNASLIQAVLANENPDLSLRLPRSQPVNLAMRNALYDLTKFDDYEEVSKRFMKGASIPYIYEGGVYALPDTQLFYMLFYRKDIFKELGVAPPKTWDEFLEVATVISRSNMYVGVPYVSDNSQENSGVGAVSLFPTILLQNGGKMYSADLTRTELSSPVSLQSFEFWSSLYTNYKFPVTYSFFNRFRTGEMPMAIATYTLYTTLTVAAPEIANSWGISGIPGVLNEDGTVNNVETGGGTGSVILNKSQHKNAAWTFLKWWTSTETQVKYSKNLESLLGPLERQATANVDALRQLSWNREDTEALLNQWSRVEEIPEIPGGYYTMRAIDQAFWNVYNKGKNVGDVLTTWARTADAEIMRKREEYGLGS